MRRLAVFSMVLLAGWSSARADALSSDGARVKSVKIYPEGAYVSYGDGYICVWGVHPADVSDSPCPVGGGMLFRSKDFSAPEKTGDMVRIISQPSSEIRTEIVSASTKEAELNTAKRFEAYVTR